MPLQFVGKLKIVSKGKSFTNKETGEVREGKYTHVFAVQDAEGNPQIVELAAKVSYEQYLDELVECEVTLYPMREGSGFWAAITSCEPAVIK